MLVEILLVLVATSPETSMISAALIAPVAVMLLALVVMFDVLVEIFDVLVEMFEVFVEMLLALVATSPETSMISAALIAPVAVIFVALVEIFDVFVEILLALVATSPETSMMSAALIAPVAVMFVALVEMLEVFVEMLEVFVEMLEVFVEIFEVFATTKPDTVDMSPVGEVVCSVLSPKISFLSELRAIFSVEVQASVAFSQVHFLSLSVDLTTIPPSFIAASSPIAVPLFEANSNCLSAIVTVVLSK